MGTKSKINYVIFIQYLFGRTNSKKYFCKYCSIPIKEENFSFEKELNIKIHCNNTSKDFIFETGHFDKNLTEFNFCQCDIYTIKEKSDKKTWNIFMQTLYWLISIDQELHSLLVMGSNNNLPQYPEIYYNFEKLFRFPKLRAHNYWRHRHHIDPEFIFRVAKTSNENIKTQYYPEIDEFIKTYSNIWGEVKRWMITSDTTKMYSKELLINTLDRNFKTEIEKIINNYYT
jgi:hypothetical protein